MPPTEEEELDPQSEVLKDIKDWALMSEADGMRARYGKPPRPAAPGDDALALGQPMHPRDPMDPLQPEEGMGGGMAGEDDPEIPGVEQTEDGEPLPSPGAGDEPDEEELLAALAAMGG